MRLMHLSVALSLAAAAPVAASYADLADRTLAAPAVVRASIVKTERISEKDSPGIPAGHARLLVSANVEAALVASVSIVSSITYLWDAPLDPHGKPPRPKGDEVLLFIATPDAAGQTRLIGSGAQRAWDAADEATVKAIAGETRGGTVPVVTGVEHGFRDVGAIPGEAESQFFLTTADGRGLTLVVTTRPGEARRVTVSQADVIDESARPVRRETLLWYRLACFLPARAPASVAADAGLAADYRAALASLGECVRSN